jgi:uncharacterized membrane protein YdjX (TVP38/TMEM64 family)
MLKKHLGKIIFVILGIIFFVIFFYFKLYTFFTYDNVQNVKNFILKFNFFGPVIICLLYIIFNIFCLPTFFFTFISGYLYGPVYGFIAAWIGMSAGFMASFFNARYLFRKDFIEKYGKNKMVIKLEEYAGKYKGLSALFFRIILIVPYNLQNVAYGLSSISVFQYLWGSMCGIVPITIFYVWLGSALSNNQITLTGMRNVVGILFIVLTIFCSIFFTGLLLKKKFFPSSGSK